MSSYQGSNSCQQLLAQVTPLFEGKEVADSLPSFLLPACRAADTDVVGACTGYHQWVCVWRGGGSLLQSQRLKDTPAPWSQQLPDGDKYDQWHHWLQQSLIFISGGLVLRWRLGEQSMSQCSSGELMIRLFFSLEMACRDDPCLCSGTASVIDVFHLSCCTSNINVNTVIHIRPIL